MDLTEYINYIAALLYGVWGFERGLNQYEYENINNTKFFVDKIIKGLCGSVIYINPFFYMIIIFL